MNPTTDGCVADISVVMACYTEERLDGIKAALESVRNQSLQPRQIIVAVDNNPGLAKVLAQELEWATVVLNDIARGVSATRNRGVEMVQTALTAFLDDDEIADPNWLLELTQPFASPDVIGTGGKCEPVWPSGKPTWYPDDFTWVVGGSYFGLPTVTSPRRNVWSGNMAVRTQVFRQVGGFRTDFGKRGKVSQPEDTDLCLRMSAASGGQWMYVPTSIIDHDVPVGRASLRFFIARCYSEGAGKAMMRQNLNSESASETERAFARTAAVVSLRRLVSLRPAVMVQGLVGLLGLVTAAWGYVREELAGAIRRAS